MKAPIASVTIARFRPGSGTPGTESYVRQSLSVKSWGHASALISEWSRATDTRENFSASILVRPRWKNGLTLHEAAYSLEEAVALVDIGKSILEEITEAYGTKKLRSAKAAMARECLARCAFTDEEDVSEDARTLDVVDRALRQCFPDDAQIHMDRVRAWMLDGGRVK